MTDEPKKIVILPDQQEITMSVMEDGGILLEQKGCGGYPDDVIEIASPSGVLALVDALLAAYEQWDKAHD